MPDYTSTSARAERGALLLDAALPGWALHIRPGKLDMSDPTRCVLGQLAQHDPRVGEGLKSMMHPDLAAASCGTYRSAAMVVFGGWPLAARLHEYGFTGSVWATIRKGRVDLLEAAWLMERDRRGAPKAGRRLEASGESIDAPLET